MALWDAPPQLIVSVLTHLLSLSFPSRAASLKQNYYVKKKTARGNSLCCDSTVPKWTLSKGRLAASALFRGTQKSAAKRASVPRKHPQGKARSTLWSPWGFTRVTGALVNRSASLAALSAWEIRWVTSQDLESFVWSTSNDVSTWQFQVKLTQFFSSTSTVLVIVGWGLNVGIERVLKTKIELES